MMDAKVVAYGRRKGRTQSLTESSLSADQEISPSQVNSLAPHINNVIAKMDIKNADRSIAFQ